MNSPIRGEARIQMMSDETLQARLREIDATPRGRIMHVGEDERRELILELRRRELVREGKERTQASLRLHNELRKKRAKEGIRIDPNRYR